MLSDGVDDSLAIGDLVRPLAVEGAGITSGRVSGRADVPEN
jgi:hypothetical protein